MVKEGVEREFDRTFSEQYFIHRTRQNFERDVDDFENMANDGIQIINRMIENDLNGRYDREISYGTYQPLSYHKGLF